MCLKFSKIQQGLFFLPTQQDIKYIMNKFGCEIWTTGPFLSTMCNASPLILMEGIAVPVFCMQKVCIKNEKELGQQSQLENRKVAVIQINSVKKSFKSSVPASYKLYDISWIEDT